MPSDLTSLVEYAEDLVKSKNYAGAVTAADAVLSVASLSRLAIVRGNALLYPLMEQLMDDSVDDPSRAAFDEALEMFNLALKLEPENATAKKAKENMEKVFERLIPDGDHQMAMSADPYDVIIVGAGASGVGVALMLTRVFHLDPQRVLLLERGGAVGETFRRWPREMRFISPSFNQQGWTKSFDLNSVAFGTSPGFTLHAEHPTGEQYAAYLSAVAEAAGLCVRTHTEVLAVRTRNGEEGFDVDVAPVAPVDFSDFDEPMLLQSRFVIWAAGEFQYPTAAAAATVPPRPSSSFLGSEHCQHNSSVRSWRELSGDDFVVIGGYESGMDAASNLAACGKRCTVVSSTAYWNIVTADPSTELSPYTAERVRAACASAVPPRLLAPLRVVAVEAPDEAGGDYLVRAKWGPPVEHPGGEFRITLPAASAAVAASDCVEGSELTLRTPQPPLLCTGFAGSVAASAAVRDLFEWGEPQSDGDGEGINSHGGSHGDSGHACDRSHGDSGHTCDKDCDEGHGSGHGDNGHTCDLDCDDGHGSGHGSGHAGGHAGGHGHDHVLSSKAPAPPSNSPRLNEHDESTKTPGLFLVGPAVRHGQLSFCFIYKFRQRFAIVAETIARELGFSTEEAVNQCKRMNMYLGDFECCEDLACGETC
jgi:hypothetical protein